MKVLLLGTLLLRSLNAHALVEEADPTTTSTPTPIVKTGHLNAAATPTSGKGSRIAPVGAMALDYNEHPSPPAGGPPAWPSYDPDFEGTGEWDGEDYGDEPPYYGNDGKKGKTSKGKTPKGKGGDWGSHSDSDEECPKWCKPGYLDSDPDSDEDSYPSYPVIAKSSFIPKRRDARNNVYRRQPESTPISQGFGGFQWPKKKTVGKSSALYGGPDDEEEDDDMSDWMTGGKTKTTKKKCPKKCLGATPTPSDSYSVVTPRPKGKKTSTKKLSGKTTRSPFPPFTYTGYPTEPTTTANPYPVQPIVTTLVTMTAEFTGPYTGPTLAEICPKSCDPFNPALNKCDITTSCTTTGGNAYMCACRAGYRADGWNAKDFSRQAKIPGLPYVYVEAGQVCDTLCSDQTCSEVLERPKCM
jgi:hypothetical protein